MHLVKSISVSPRFQPFGHESQVVLLNPNLPIPQSVQEAEPGSLVNVPTVHCIHFLKSLSLFPRFQPAGHALHVVLLRECVTN